MQNWNALTFIACQLFQHTALFAKNVQKVCRRFASVQTRDELVSQFQPMRAEYSAQVTNQKPEFWHETVTWLWQNSMWEETCDPTLARAFTFLESIFIWVNFNHYDPAFYLCFSFLLWEHKISFHRNCFERLRENNAFSQMLNLILLYLVKSFIYKNINVQNQNFLDKFKNLENRKCFLVSWLNKLLFTEKCFWTFQFPPNKKPLHISRRDQMGRSTSVLYHMYHIWPVL